MAPQKVKFKVGRDPDGTPFIYDVTTTNISFLQTARDLKKLGIKNNMFFLKLYNRDLVGVDPYDPNISNSMINAILLECLLNPYYFLREISRIPEVGGAIGPGSGSRFILHRGNLALIWATLHHISNYLVIPRQCYKTHSTLALLLWIFLCGTTNSLFNFSNKRQQDADANLTKFKSHRDLLPLFLQQKYSFVEEEYNLNGKSDVKIYRGLSNVRCILNPITLNRIESKPSATTEEAAIGIGRGNSAPIQYYDEVEFTKWIGHIFRASGPAYLRSAEIAAKNDAAYCRILTTTPGNIDSQPVEDSEAIRDQCATFTELFYDMNDQEVKQYMDIHSENNMTYIEFTYKQIGMDENWFRTACREACQNNKIDIKRELLLQRIRGNSQSPFEIEDLDTINDNRKPPIQEVMICKKFLFSIYRELDKNTPYIIGVDCASGMGVGSDYTVAMFIDPYDLTTVAVLKTKYADAPESAEMLAELVMRYAPKGVLCIERNNLGVGIIGILARTPVAGNIYYDYERLLADDGVDKLDKKGYLDVSAEQRRYWGVNTTPQTRNIMTKEILTYQVHEHKDRFQVRELIDELNNLIMKGANDRIEAAPGKHDDCVMAYCIGMYVYLHGPRLSRYGIYKGMTREMVDKKGKGRKMTYEEIYAQLPADMKEIFPPPNQGIVSLNSDVLTNQPQQTDPNSGFVQGKSDNEIYRQIQEIQGAKRVVKTSTGDEVVVKNNNPHIYRELYEGKVTREYNPGVLDLCKIINKF